MNNYKIRIIFSAFFAAVFTALFFIMPNAMNTGIKNGLQLCASTIIPSMFPFIIMSDYMIRSGLCGKIGRVFGKMTNKIFKLSGSCACVIFVSLFGGFPVGAKMTAQLVENGEISENQGQRMMFFCVNGGPAFVINAVGVSMLSSRRAGIILYVSLVLSSLIIGFFTRFFAEKKTVTFLKIKTEFRSSVFSQSVSESVKTVFNICAWVLVFSCVNGYAEYLPIDEKIKSVIYMLSEVTSGCAVTAGKMPLWVLAVVIGWSGISVQCQVYDFVKKTGLKMRKFILARLLNGVLAGLICKIILYFFPCDISTFATNTGVAVSAYSVSLPAAVSMILLAVFMLADSKTTVFLDNQTN